MTYGSRWLIVAAILFASALSGGCAATMEERAYVKDTLTRDAITTQPFQQASDSLPAAVRKLYAARLTSGHSAEPGATFYNPDAINRSPEPLSTIETRAIMDVAVEFQWDADNLVPAYRFIMTPYKNVGPQPIDAWRQLAVVKITSGKYSRIFLVAPLPPVGQRLVDGQVITPWTFCEVCFESGQGPTRLPKMEQVMQYQLQRDKFAINFDSPNIGFPSKQGIHKLQFLNADPHKNIGDAVFVAGTPAAVQSARKEFVDRLKARVARERRVKSNNNIYKHFLDKKYGPLHLAGHFTKAGPACDDYSTVPNTNRGVETNQELMDENYAFIDCAQRALQQYDIQAYTAMYPDLVKREQTLWEKTRGAKREKILTPEEMVAWGRGHIEKAYVGIERMQARISGLRARQARKQAQSNALNTILASMNQAIAQQKTDNRNRQLQLDRLQAQARRPRHKAPPNRSHSAGNQASQTVAQTQSSNTPQSTAKAAEQASKNNGATGSIVNAAAQAKASDNTSQSPAVQVATASPVAPLRPEPVAGGEQGCVALVETNRYPGKSALSSCLYSEPERESLEMKFLNSCGVPVNISIDLQYDNGTNRKTKEYDVKPGKRRTTTGHCGATRYAYSYEETHNSLNSRSQ